MDDLDHTQRLVLGLLLRRHPAMVTLGWLQEMLPEFAGVEEAVTHLERDGVATRLGELVGASRAAVRTGQLSA